MTDGITSEAGTTVSASPANQSVLVVTGMSGAGRSTVGNALEDLGWYVVDNLPPQMLRPLLDLAGHSGDRLSRVAVVVDVRGGQLLSELNAPGPGRSAAAAEAALPRGQRRRAGAAVRGRAPAASDAGHRHAPRRHHR